MKPWPLPRYSLAVVRLRGPVGVLGPDTVVPLEFHSFWTRRKAENAVDDMNLHSRGRERSLLTAYAVYDRWYAQVVNAD
jgi:hypothetical protein